jgi:hypothetical protein
VDSDAGRKALAAELIRSAQLRASDIRGVGYQVISGLMKKFPDVHLRHLEDIFIPGRFVDADTVMHDLVEGFGRVKDYLTDKGKVAIYRQVMRNNLQDMTEKMLGVVYVVEHVMQDARFGPPLALILAEVNEADFGRRVDLVVLRKAAQDTVANIKTIRTEDVLALIEVKWLRPYTAINTADYRLQMYNDIWMDLSRHNDVRKIHWALPDNYQRMDEAKAMVKDLWNGNPRRGERGIEANLRELYHDDPEMLAKVDEWRDTLFARVDGDQFFIRTPHNFVWP